MVLDLLLPVVVSVNLVVSRIHLGQPICKLLKVLIQVYLGTIQIDFFMLLNLRCLVLLHVVVDNLQLPFHASAFLMPLLWINSRLHHILRQFHYLVPLLVSNSRRIEPIRLFAASRSSRGRRDVGTGMRCLSYVLLVEEGWDVDETCGHDVVILVVVVIIVLVKHVKHLASSLNVDGSHVLGRALITYVLVVHLVKVLATEYGGPLINVIIEIIIVKIASVHKLSLLRLLKSEFPPNELTICQVIDDKTNGLTISAQKRFLRKVLRQVHLEPLQLFDQRINRFLFRTKLFEPHVWIRILHLWLQPCILLWT